MYIDSFIENMMQSRLEEPADVSDQSDQEQGAKNKNNKKRQLPFTR